jgi:hypothetical protein
MLLAAVALVPVAPKQGSPCACACIANNRQRYFAGRCAPGISCVSKKQRYPQAQGSLSPFALAYKYSRLKSNLCFWLCNATYARCAEAKDPCLGATGTTFARSLSKATFAFGYATQRHKEGQQGRQECSWPNGRQHKRSGTRRGTEGKSLKTTNKQRKRGNIFKIFHFKN